MLVWRKVSCQDICKLSLWGLVRASGSTSAVCSASTAYPAACNCSLTADTQQHPLCKADTFSDWHQPDAVSHHLSTALSLPRHHSSSSTTQHLVPGSSQGMSIRMCTPVMTRSRPTMLLSFMPAADRALTTISSASRVNIVCVEWHSVARSCMEPSNQHTQNSKPDLGLSLQRSGTNGPATISCQHLMGTQPPLDGHKTQVQGFVQVLSSKGPNPGTYGGIAGDDDINKHIIVFSSIRGDGKPYREEGNEGWQQPLR